MTSQDIALVAMRLSDMWRMHPRQDNSRVCSKCGEAVGIYPSGQDAIRHNPGMKIICSRCAEAERDPPDKVRPAGSWDEIAQESRDSYDVGKA